MSIGSRMTILGILCHGKEPRFIHADGVPRETLQFPEAAKLRNIRGRLLIGHLLSFAGRRFGAMSAAASTASRDIENHEGCQRDPN
jgi:hypothetical protein